MGWLDDLIGYSQESLGEREREALWMRGVSDSQIAEFRLGCLDRQLPDLKGATSFLKWSSDGDKLRDVFVFPLTNALGDIKGVQFRHVDREEKGYIDFFESQEEPVLFGLGQAAKAIWETESIFLVEGTFDLFPVQRVHAQTVATLHAGVSEDMMRWLRRNVARVWLGYDNDDPGLRASREFRREHGDEFETRIVEYPKVKMVNGRRTKDPSDLWEVWGDGRLGTYLRKQQNPLEALAHG